MPVGAPVDGKTGVHEPQTVEQLRSRTKGTADSRDSGALMQRQRGGDVQNLVNAGFRRLRHSSARVGRQGFQIAPGALRIQNAQRQRRFSGTGNPGNAHNFSEGNVHIDIFQIVDLRPTNQYFINHFRVSPYSR